MRRVASLYLPQLPIERLRRRAPSRASPERAPQLPIDDDPGACSVPRGGGWRPGARWARDERPTRAEVDAKVDALSPHRRPPTRELGRRTEAAPHPFRAMRSDDGGGMSGLTGIATDSARQPMVLAMTTGQRELVYAACPDAKAFGLHPGMAVSQARAFVADLDVRPAAPDADLALLQRFVVHAIRHWTPSAAVSDADGIWLDLHGTTHLFGGEERFCRQVLGFFDRLGFTARIAIADSSGAAHAMARFARAPLSIVAGGRTIEAIAPLPVDALRLDDDTVATAHRFGLERIADLLAMPRAPLARRLGTTTLTRLDQAIGREIEQIVPVTLVDPVLVTRQLAEAIGTAEAIEYVINDLVAEMTAQLLERGHGARRLRLTFRRVDDAEQAIVIGTARPTRDAKHVARLFRLKIETVDPGLGIESARLLAERVEPLDATQASAAFPGETIATDLAPLVDQLIGRVGERAVFRAAPVESDVPERAVARVNPLAAPGSWPGWRRPARMLRRPEPLHNVVALLPDHPPRRFSWRGVPHVVTAGDGPERIHGEWWVRDGELWAVRDYFRVEDDAGRHYWLFRRGDGVQAETGDLTWFMHGVG